MEVKLTLRDFHEFLRDEVLTPRGANNWNVPGGEYDPTLYSYEQKQICNQLAWCLRISRVHQLQDNVSINDERINNPSWKG